MIQRVNDVGDKRECGWRECINLALNVLNDFSKNGWCSVNSKNVIHLSRDRSCRWFSTTSNDKPNLACNFPQQAFQIHLSMKEEVFGFPSDQFVWAPHDLSAQAAFSGILYLPTQSLPRDFTS